MGRYRGERGPSRARPQIVIGLARYPARAATVAFSGAVSQSSTTCSALTRLPRKQPADSRAVGGASASGRQYGRNLHVKQGARLVLQQTVGITAPAVPPRQGAHQPAGVGRHGTRMAKHRALVHRLLQAALETPRNESPAPITAGAEARLAPSLFAVGPQGLELKRRWPIGGSGLTDVGWQPRRDVTSVSSTLSALTMTAAIRWSSFSEAGSVVPINGLLGPVSQLVAL